MLNLLQLIISTLVARLNRDERGAVAIEYILLAGVGAIGIVAGVSILFAAAGGFFQDIATSVSDALTP